MPFLPVHSEQQLSRVGAPYLTWGTMLFCVMIQVWLSGLPPTGEWQAVYAFGFIPGAFFEGIARPQSIDVLPVPATLVTYQFLHGGVAHLVANMIALFVFGALVEDRLHHIRYTILFLGSGMAAALLQGAMFPESTTALVGASGAIAGVMGAYLVLFPRNRITLLTPIFLPIRLRAWVIIVVWVGVQVYMSQNTGEESGVAWWAHIGGFVVGVVVGGWYRRRLPA